MTSIDVRILGRGAITGPLNEPLQRPHYVAFDVETRSEYGHANTEMT